MKSELKVMFFSPIAWLVLVVIAFQVGTAFHDQYESSFRWQSLGNAVFNTTSNLMANPYGVFVQMLENLYLYIPLLTMGLMSREFGSGSIKLLYSSPVSNFQIIIGKYLSVVVYGLLLVIIMSLPGFWTIFTTKDPNLLMICVGALGVFLTICAYAAIGLFMSTLTHYQVVAVVTTLITLAILNFIGDVGRENDIIRDITYWLSISGRSSVFLKGLISTKDLLYFMLVIFMFLSMSIIKLRGERLKLPALKSALTYASVLLFTIVVGYISSLPTMAKYYDSTIVEINTLTPYSQAVLAEVEGGLTITSYVNYLDETWYDGSPSNINYDSRMFDKYVRFKPEIKLKYVYYYGDGYDDYYNKNYAHLNYQEKFDTLADYREMDISEFITQEEVFNPTLSKKTISI